MALSAVDYPVDTDGRYPETKVGERVNYSLSGVGEFGEYNDHGTRASGIYLGMASTRYADGGIIYNPVTDEVQFINTNVLLKENPGKNFWDKQDINTISFGGRELKPEQEIIYGERGGINIGVVINSFTTPKGISYLLVEDYYGEPVILGPKQSESWEIQNSGLGEIKTIVDLLRTFTASLPNGVPEDDDMIREPGSAKRFIKMSDIARVWMYAKRRVNYRLELENRHNPFYVEYGDKENRYNTKSVALYELLTDIFNKQFKSK